MSGRRQTQTLAFILTIKNNSCEIWRDRGFYRYDICKLRVILGSLDLRIPCMYSYNNNTQCILSVVRVGPFGDGDGDVRRIIIFIDRAKNPNIGVSRHIGAKIRYNLGATEKHIPRTLGLAKNGALVLITGRTSKGCKGRWGINMTKTHAFSSRVVLLIVAGALGRACPESGWSCALLQIFTRDL